MLPESPRYLLLKGRDAEARKALSTLTRRPADSAEVDEECLDISMALEAERAMGKTVSHSARGTRQLWVSLA